MKKIFCRAAVLLLTLAMLIVPAFGLVNGIFLGSDKDGVNILNDRLRPGEEYWFPVLLAVDGAPPTQLTGEDLDRCTIAARVVGGGTAVRSVSVEEKLGLVYLCVVAGKEGTVQEHSAKLRINYQARDSKENVTVIPALKVGYESMPDDRISLLDPGEFVAVDAAAPIISTNQWESLSRLNEHSSVTLNGLDWRYTVNTTGLGKRNMAYNHSPVEELVQQFSDRQLHFLSFPGEPDFTVRGQLTIDVSKFAEAYNHDLYLYRCAYGKLYPLAFDYDRDAGEISFRPSQLSTYLITDRGITLSDNLPVSRDDMGIVSDDMPAPVMNPVTGQDGNGFMAWLVSLASMAGLGLLTASKRRP